MKIYIGNLTYDTTDDDITSAFEMYGEVKNTNLILDNETGKSKGFGFVEMSEKQDGEKAIAELNGKDIKGRNVKVNEARPRTDTRPLGNPPKNKFAGRY
jgi:cold-inducible RNA-binding protein